MAPSIWQKIARTKPMDKPAEGSRLSRCLTTFDLTLMAAGTMLGSGIYVMTGVAAKQMAGPAIVISFLIAGLVIALAAACFTEFATRFDRAGSSYLYFYISFGELLGFSMGLGFLSCAITVGAVSARTWSAYLDTLLNGAVSNFTENNIAEWTVGPPISRYPDFIGCVLVIVLTVVVSLGADFSARLNNVMVFVNVFIILFVAIVGFVYADLDNWTSQDTGGFMPFGWSGVLTGAGACFYSLDGFEMISMAAEEIKNPRRSIPIATAVVVAISTVLYMTMSAAITLITPYTEIDIEAPLPSAFQLRGITWAQYIAAIGPMFGLLTSLSNCIYGGARLIYAMAADGLLPPLLAKVHARTHVPIIATVLVGVIMCLLALFLELADLLGFSIAILLIQQIGVAFAVITLRYRFDGKSEVGVQDSSSSSRVHTYGTVDARVEQSGKSEEGTDYAKALVHRQNRNETEQVTESTSLLASSSGEQRVRLRSRFSSMERCFKPFAGRWVDIATFLVLVVSLLLAFIMFFGIGELSAGSWWAILLVCLLVVVLVLLLASVWIHLQNINTPSFQVPCVPVLPAMTILACSVLLVSSSTANSWIGVGVIVLLCLVIYFVYGIRFSKLNEAPDPLVESDDVRVDPVHDDDKGDNLM